jgi:hypothetical protein
VERRKVWTKKYHKTQYDGKLAYLNRSETEVWHFLKTERKGASTNPLSVDEAWEELWLVARELGVLQVQRLQLDGKPAVHHGHHVRDLDNGNVG